MGVASMASSRLVSSPTNAKPPKLDVEESFKSDLSKKSGTSSSKQSGASQSKMSKDGDKEEV